MKHETGKFPQRKIITNLNFFTHPAHILRSQRLIYFLTRRSGTFPSFFAWISLVCRARRGKNSGNPNFIEIFHYIF